MRAWFGGETDLPGVTPLLNGVGIGSLISGRRKRGDEGRGTCREYMPRLSIRSETRVVRLTWDVMLQYGVIGQSNRKSDWYATRGFACVRGNELDRAGARWQGLGV